MDENNKDAIIASLKRRIKKIEGENSLSFIIVIFKLSYPFSTFFTNK